MEASKYKKFKGIRKESLRDNMTNIEVILTDLGEFTARDIALSENPKGLKDNLCVAKRGGDVAKEASDLYEIQTGHKTIANENAIGGIYIRTGNKIDKV